jgi:hypothetical protein
MQRPSAGALVLSVVLTTLLMAGCGTPPPAATSADAGRSVPADVSPAAVADGSGQRAVERSRSLAHYEAQLNALAEDQARLGCLADAALSLEILTLLRPASEVYRRQSAELHQRIGSKLSETMAKATQQRRRGETAAATQSFLEALALQPDHAAAITALREMESQRNRRRAADPTVRLAPAPVPRQAATAKDTAKAAARSANPAPDYDAMLARLASQGGQAGAAAGQTPAGAGAATCVSYEDWAARRAGTGSSTGTAP